MSRVLYSCLASDSQDLLIPFAHVPRSWQHSPLQGVLPRERNILLFFRGDVGAHRQVKYQKEQDKLVLTFPLTSAEYWSTDVSMSEQSCFSSAATLVSRKKPHLSMNLRM